MGDEQHGDLAPQCVDGFGERVGCFLIERRSRFVEHEHFRCLEERPGNGEPLLLTAGQARASFAHFGLVALGKSFDRGVDARHPACAHDLFERGRWVAGQQVGKNGAGEEHGLLRNDPKYRAQLVGTAVPGVDPVDSDAAATWHVEAEQQLCQRALARARRTDDRDNLARFDRQVELIEEEGAVLCMPEGQRLKLESTSPASGVLG